MSDRHIHITGMIYDDQGVIEQFIRAAEATNFFRFVTPVRFENGPIRAVAFYSKDLDGISDELEMEDIADKLSGILRWHVELVSAWDNPVEGGRYPDRERVWLIRGRKGADPETAHAVR